MTNNLNPDFVIAVIYMAAMFTAEDLEHVANVEWRDEQHLKDEIKLHISENDWYNFEQYWQDIRRNFNV